MDTYGELKTDIKSWLNREDLDSLLAGFIRQAEIEIYRDLRSDENEFVILYDETNATIESSGTHTPIARAVDDHVILPTNYAEMSLVEWNDKSLQHVSYQDLSRRLYENRDSEPEYFAIRGRRIYFSNTIDNDFNNWTAGSELRYTYYGTESLHCTPTWQVAVNPVDNPVQEDNSPEGLGQTDSNTTRLLQRNYNVYLWGGVYHGFLYLRDKVHAPMFKGLFDQALADLRLESHNRMLSGSTSEVTSVYAER